MMLFPMTSPRSGLYLSPSRLCIADFHKTFGEPRLLQYREHPIPEKCLHLSSSQNNITNPDQLLQIFQALIPVKHRPKSVAICLPDICTRMGIFEFAKLPKNKEEQKSLIAWRLEKDLNVSTSTARVAYQIYPTQPSPSAPTDPPIYRVIATTIQHSIVESYEMLCLKAGLIPMSMGVASMSVFNLSHTLIDSTTSLVSQKVELLPEHRILIYLADWGYTVLIFRDNTPAFIRIKPLRSSALNQLLPIPANQEKTSHGTGIDEVDARDDIQKLEVRTPDIDPNDQQYHALANELIGTMQYYFDGKPISAPAGSIIPVFLCGSLAPHTVLPAIADIIDRELPTAGDNVEIGIKTFPMMPTNEMLPFKSLFGLTSWTSNTLPTFGGAISGL